MVVGAEEGLWDAGQAALGGVRAHAVRRSDSRQQGRLEGKARAGMATLAGAPAATHHPPGPHPHPARLEWEAEERGAVLQHAPHQLPRHAQPLRHAAEGRVLAWLAGQLASA